MRGGTKTINYLRVNPAGLSPHARGNHRVIVPLEPSSGPIPACAGEPAGMRRSRGRVWAYPRMRGGTCCSCC